MKHASKFTVIFLVDQYLPKNIILLKRAETKPFAPGYFTGIGGKVGDQLEYANETVLEGAYRELKEETLGSLNKATTHLIEFARFRYENGITLHYFSGLYHSFPNLPKVSNLDGSLLWVNTSKLLQYDIIPTTKIICDYWNRNQFQLTPFTVYGREIGINNTVRLVETLRVKQGLH